MDIRERIRASLEKYPPRDMRFAYVFGSAATGTMHAESDVDLAVDFGRELTFEERADLVACVGEATGRAADIVDLHTANPELRMQVLRKGIVVYCGDERARAEFEMHTPSMHEDFRRERRELERALIARMVR